MKKEQSLKMYAVIAEIWTCAITRSHLWPWFKSCLGLSLRESSCTNSVNINEINSFKTDVLFSCHLDFALWLSNTKRLPGGDALETRECLRLPIKRSWLLCRTFVVLGCQQSFASVWESKTRLPHKNVHAAQQSQFEMSANHDSFHVCRRDEKIKSLL